MLLVSGVLLFNKCMSETAGEPDPIQQQVAFNQFAGSAACASCHKDVYEKHHLTEHHLTSQASSARAIMGSFSAGKNVFVFDGRNRVQMEERDSAFYQIHYQSDEEVQKGRFDLVIGSGRKGQSYLSWVEDRYLVQMPITYFTPAGQWSNSPGYPPSKVVFNRPITARCMECHSTFAHTESTRERQPDNFSKNQIILGVECERCHGPGSKHVAFQTSNPGASEARFIVNPSRLPRQQQLDLCALCHGGQLKKTQPSFQFTAGDTLTNFFSVKNMLFNAGNIDVHGNQLGLLSLSRCFTLTQMTCTSCHSVHEKEENKTAVFSQRCQNCHSEAKTKICKMTTELGPAISKNCIDCHMPRQPSHAVAVFLQGATAPTPAFMRTHYIKVYPEEVKKVTAWLKRQKVS